MRGIELQEQAALLDMQHRISEEARAHLMAILDGIGDAVLVVDPAGAIVLANPAYQRSFGSKPVAPQDAAGRPLPAADDLVARGAHGEAFALKFTLADTDGSMHWFEARGEPVHSDGVLRWSVIVIRDITDRSLRRLQEQFVANVSHGLQTPIATHRMVLM